MNILFLYTELADYTIACLRALKSADPSGSIKIIHYAVNPEAPFLFDHSELGEFTCINQYNTYQSIKDDVQRFGPEIIVCSGWVNRWYIKLCRHYRKYARTILCVDNWWVGNVKQKMLALLAPLTIRNMFSRIWVPGSPQMEYAGRLGFKREDILTGYYCCDTPQFKRLFLSSKEKKQVKMPHRFLCAARYVPQKNYGLLWNAFITWKKRHPNDWELWCTGTGEDFPHRVEHPSIKHLGFVQGKQWEDIVDQTSVFVLPSRSEPWGVVVHEFATAGYPLIISRNVGAGSLFLSKNNNGFDFDPNNEEELIRHFETIRHMSDEQLFGFGRKSHDLSQQLTVERWAHTLIGA